MSSTYIWPLIFLLVVASPDALFKLFACAAPVNFPCAVAGARIGANYPVAPSLYVACLRLIPYNPAAAKLTLDTLRNSVELYVYTDIARNSPDPRLPSRVDLKKGLAKIATTKYPSDFDFHLDIYKLFNALNDGHTLFQSCYFTAANYIMLVPLVSIVDSKKNQRIVVDKSVGYGSVPMVTATEKWLGFPLVSLAGAEVLSIGGMNAKRYVLEYTRHQVGQIRDPVARVNAALGRFSFIEDGSSGFVPGGINQRQLPPGKDYLTMVVRMKGSLKPKKLAAPFFVEFVGFPFTNVQNFYDGNCLPKKNAAAESLTSTSVAGAPPPSSPHTILPPLTRLLRVTQQSDVNSVDATVEEVMTSADVESSLKRGAAAKPSSLPPVLLLYNKIIKLFLIPESRTGVVVIPTFSDTTGALTNQLFSALEIFSNLMDAGKIRRMLLHLSDNGGGTVILGNTLSQVLFGEKPSAVNIPLQFRSSPFALKMRKQAILMPRRAGNSSYAWRGYEDLQDRRFASPNQFFFPLEKNLLGGKPGGVYSRRMKRTDLTPLLLNPVPAFNRTNLLILTNGYCMSTCSIFSMSAEEKYGITTVGVGGVYGKPMAYSTMCVGFTYTLDSLLSNDVNPLELAKDPEAPQPFAFDGVLGFVLAQGYTKATDKVPCDFVYRPAKVRIPYVARSVDDVTYLWRQAAKHFPTK